MSRALRGSDGAIVLVDALEGIMTQTVTNINLAVGSEWCRPALFINKVDRLIMEQKLPPERIITRFNEIIAEVNRYVEDATPKEIRGKWKIDPQEGLVIFGSAKDGWGFTLPMLQKKNLSAKVVLEKYKEALTTNSKEPIEWLKSNLPLVDAMLEVVIKHLPSPIQAQKYRMAKLWSGDIKKGMNITDVNTIKDDPEAFTAYSLINVNRDGPLLGMITKIEINPKSKRPTLIGRIWSGTLRTGDTIYLLSAKKTARIRRLGVFELDNILPCDEVPAGNLFAIELPEMIPSGESFVDPAYKDTIAGFEKIKYVSDAVVSRSIKPVDAKDLGKLGEVVNKWVMADPTAKFRKSEESGEYVLSGIDPLQIEILVKRIQEECPIKVGIPITVYHEGLLEKGIEIHTKCSEGLNKLKLYMEPMNEKTIELLRSGKVVESQEEKERANLLRDADWDKKESRRIWAIEGMNILVNGTMGVQRLDRIKGYVCSTFREFSQSSALAKEPAMGLKVTITDATIHEDPAHTKSAQIFVMTVSALNISFLTGNPALYEPLLRIDIKTDVNFMGAVMTILTTHRGKVVETTQTGQSVEIHGEVPASEAVRAGGGEGADGTAGIADELRSATQGRAMFGYQFARFQMLPKGLQETIILKIRERKKEAGIEISTEMPSPFTFKNRMYPDPGYWKKPIIDYIGQFKSKLVLPSLLRDA